MSVKRKCGRLILTFIIIVFFSLAIAILIIGCNQRNETIPTIDIVLDNYNKTNIGDFSKGEKYPVDSIIIGDDNYGAVTIERRGHSTWDLSEKKPFRLKFKDKVDLFEMGRTRKWALLANSFDDTMIRNYLAGFIGSMLDENFSFKGEYVWLKINDEDYGLYYLAKEVAIDKSQINIDDFYGVMMEMDNYYCHEETNYYLSKNDDCFTIKAVVSDDNYEVAAELFMKKYDQLENAIDKKNFERIKELIDVESFADYFILSELSNNPDAYCSSWFFYMDGEDDKIHVGPIWDYDFAFGNTNWGYPEGEDELYNPMFGMNRKEAAENATENELVEKKISLLMFHLMDIEDFKNNVVDIYRRKIMSKNNLIIEAMNKKVDVIRDYVEKDHEIWKKDSFEESVKQLKWWVEQRLVYMESTYGNSVLLKEASREI